MDISKQDQENINFADEHGKLNNKRNPFIIESMKYNKKIESKKETSEEEEQEKTNKKGTKKREPLYYYYMINNNIYKYTCKKKNGKYTLPFNCSDSSCAATGKYNKNTETFLPGEIDHIPYENHSYVIPKLMKEKYEKDEFIEEDFKNNIKILGHYFKLMFLKDYTLDPTIAKSIFKNKFPNIDLSGTDINTYITTKYKEAKAINNDKIINKEKIFKLLDEKGNVISKVYDFQNENNNKIKSILL